MNKLTERKQNLRFVLEALRLHGPIEQNKLQDLCGLPASTISYLVNDLKKQDLVIEVGKAETRSRAGKPASILGLNNNAAQFMGIYVEDESLVACVIGIDGQILHSICVPYEPEEMEARLFEVIEQSLNCSGHIEGIGISIKAVVYTDGRIRSGTRKNGTRWELNGLSETLLRTFSDIPVLVENDANCAAEMYHFENKCDNFVLYILNDIPFGIGCGLMLEGRLFKGHQGAAGEFFLKGLDPQWMSSGIGSKTASIDKILTAITPHLLQTAYLLDSERFVLTGSLFRDISEDDFNRASALVNSMPLPVEIDRGEGNYLNPARGAALLAINRYIDQYLEEVTKR